MGFLIFLVVLFLVWLLFGTRISEWCSRKIHRFVANKTEDMLRKAAGMPPRPDSREGRRQRRQTSSSSSSRRTSRAGHTAYNHSGPIIPKEYAEDVEFVEIKEFSSTTIGSDSDNIRFRQESQVSDVEFTEIKNK